SVQALYTKNDKDAKPLHVISLLYFGGVERPTGAPEGQPWRHLFDAHATLTAWPRFSLQAHADGGFEDNRFGRSSWKAGALPLRFKTASWMYLAARGDVLSESLPTNSLGTAAPIFFPADRVASGTFTLEARPDDHLSIRLESRHDSASAPIYYEHAQQVPT